MEVNDPTFRRLAMHLPSACYQMQATIAHYLPDLTSAQQGCLAAWVFGTTKAKCRGQTSVAAALGNPCDGTEQNRLRQYLREGLYNGADKASPSHHDLVVTLCFAPLLRWVLAWWEDTSLPLAIDVTYQRDRLMVLAICVLYRGTAIPGGWKVVVANQKGAWTPHFIRLVDLVVPAVPETMTVLVLLDAGLRSPELWRHISAQGWHPMVRLQLTDTFRPTCWRERRAVRDFVTTSNQAWVGVGRAFGRSPLPGTLVVVWFVGQDEPLAVLTDLAPDEVGLCWYSLRMWVELGFRVLKRMGWGWQKTQRTEPARVERHWLVLAIATLYTVAYGTRIEDATVRHCDPARLHHPPSGPVVSRTRPINLSAVGWHRLRDHLATGRLWTRLWLRPEPWPADPPSIAITRHRAAP
jgi:hypothetical protein